MGTMYRMQIERGESDLSETLTSEKINIFVNPQNPYPGAEGGGGSNRGALLG